MIGPPPADSPSRATQLLLTCQFTVAEITEVRQRVEEVARRCGLDRQQASDWITAVNELMTNAVRHGGGTGMLRVWFGERLTCEVIDSGPGFSAAGYLDRASRPSPTAVGGMGLWIVQQMTDALAIESGPAGTTARISIETPAAPR